MPSIAVVDAPTVSTFAENAGERRRFGERAESVGAVAASPVAAGVAAGVEGDRRACSRASRSAWSSVVVTALVLATIAVVGCVAILVTDSS